MKPVTKKKSIKRPAIGQGWRTTDEDEIERRRQRALTEGIRVQSLPEDRGYFGAYHVSTSDQSAYVVELRSASEAINSCDCPDYEVNGLGTCKHIEAVLHLKKRRKPGRRERTEIYLDRRDQYAGGPSIRVLWADGLRRNSRVRRLLGPFVSTDGELVGAPEERIPELAETMSKARLTSDDLRISRHIGPWVKRLRHRKVQERSQTAFTTDLDKGKRDANVVNHPLYPYQVDGMLHLAFKGRAILADEMGLGKTVQAVAACELLRRLHGVERVMVISPVSLKTEWEEQIGKFTDLPVLIVQGNRQERLKQYRASSFFYLTNYEQIRYDAKEIQRLLMPDIIVLDEAQRIKNWQTKTAQAVKRLKSPYAFVLTGTPLENRIDEVYSIAQVLDPHLFGPLFRFNRDFYHLDERGRPQGYKNLDKLHHRLRPVLLRRRKHDVEDELPGRTVNTYFVGMHEEQQLRYEEYDKRVARLVAKAKRRPLSPDEFKMLQQWLACMRMLCDTPYILDPDCRVSPKLEELQRILAEQLEDPENKIIIFSEWTRMLELIREKADGHGVGYALHTGQVRQKKRREEINRFKNDPDCRLFLSSDAGATGLNLQAANVVINVDLPWNPARLEQRIARAWRKHQKRHVNVINLVSEGSIEHRILHLLEQKQNLADGVLDGKGDKEMPLPSGRKMLIERLEKLVGEPAEGMRGKTPVPVPSRSGTLEGVIDALTGHQALQQATVFTGEGESRTLFAVVKDSPEKVHTQMSEAAKSQGVEAGLEVIDQKTMATIQRLVDAGILSMNGPEKTLYRSPGAEKEDTQARKRRLDKGQQRLAEARRQLEMAHVLAAGGFEAEAIPPLGQSLEGALGSLYQVLTGQAPKQITETHLQAVLIPEGGLAEDTLEVYRRFRDTTGRLRPPPLDTVSGVIKAIDEKFNRWAG